MDKDQIDWIDPAATRRLMLEYRQTLGTKGASEIERQIYEHTKETISRKTIENWLNDPDSAPRPQTQKTCLRFLQTKHFQDLVPCARDYLESDARFCRIAAAMLDLYVEDGKDLTELAALNGLIAGWWTWSASRFRPKGPSSG